MNPTRRHSSSFNRRRSSGFSSYSRRSSLGSLGSDELSKTSIGHGAFARRRSSYSVGESEGEGRGGGSIASFILDDDPTTTTATGPHNHATAASASTSPPIAQPVVDEHGKVVGLHKFRRKVVVLRVAVVFTLLASAAIVAALCYHFTSRFEYDLFRQQYEAAAYLFIDNFQDRVSDKVNAARTFSALYTSRYGPARRWPNATMPDFQRQARGQLVLSNGRAVSFNPIIVNGTMREEWEAHATENAHVLGADQLVNRRPGKRVVADGIFRVVDGKRVDDPGVVHGSVYPDVLVPVWQIAPIKSNEAAVMFNLKSVPNRRMALDDMMRHKIPGLSDLLQLVQDVETRPSSILFYPVFDFFEGSDGNGGAGGGGGGGGSAPRVVGSISIVFSWDDVFEGSLPTYVRGIICVLETNYGSSFTFRISEGSSTLVGEGGDFHDPRYDSMVKTASASLEGTDDDYARANDLVTYSVRIYPSEELEEVYVTNMPVVYTVVVLVIFLVTSALFLLYDVLVRNRTRRVTRDAVRSNRVVDSIFPSFVRHRYLNRMSDDHLDGGSTKGDADSVAAAAAVERRRSSTTGSYGDAAALAAASAARMEHDRNSGGGVGGRRSILDTGAAVRMKEFFKSSSAAAARSERGKRDKRRTSNASLGSSVATGMSSGRPIADVFPCVTVIFADLVGFTKWSSDAAPDQVFQLLERIFAEFDLLATQHGVFKITTIWDCYMAVTGLPDPQADHAVRMCAFAVACRDRFYEARDDMVDELGRSIRKLEIRIGCHSGEVTAGVLRGQKSGFTIFGDTVNTASRMESTGIKNRIQVSSATAALLEEGGCDDWLTEREKRIKPKGKGEMQTFWVDKPPEGECSSDESDDDDGLPGVDQFLDDLISANATSS